MRPLVYYFEHEIELPLGESVLGRDPGCNIHLADDAVSRRHLRFVVTREKLSVQDIGSTNGTQLNGKRLVRLTAVADKDVLQLGHGIILVRLMPAEPREFELYWRAPTVWPIAPRPTHPALALTTCPACKLPVPADEARCPGCGSPLLFPGAPPATIRPPDPTQERRKSTRVLVAIPVLCESARGTFSGTAWDLAPGGMFIASDIQDPEVTKYRITLMPPDGPPMPVAGEVCHVVTERTRDGLPPGFGIRFTRMDELTRQWIDETCTTWEDSSYRSA
jgi:pSer/pThr/pTyr-binding forkhead associated (FHA) protein